MLDFKDMFYAIYIELYINYLAQNWSVNSHRIVLLDSIKNPVNLSVSVSTGNVIENHYRTSVSRLNLKVLNYHHYESPGTQIRALVESLDLACTLS